MEYNNFDDKKNDFSDYIDINSFKSYNYNNIDKQYEGIRNLNIEDGKSLNYKSMEIEDGLLPDLGIMMSYGTGKDLVPMGIFFVEGYYDSTGKKLDKLPLDKSDVEVLLVEYEFTEDSQVRRKEEGNKVYIPYNKAKKLYSDNATFNYDEAYDASEKKYDGRKMLANFDKEISELYKKIPALIQDGLVGLESESLESLEGSFISNDGHDMGVDFRVFPFLYSRLKEKDLYIIKHDINKLKSNEYKNVNKIDLEEEYVQEEHYRHR